MLQQTHHVREPHLPPGTYSSLTSNTTGVLAGTLGLPAKKRTGARLLGGDTNPGIQCQL